MTKIMLVEDDNNLREIYEARLAAEGYEIVSAQNGEAALAMASKERPDLIISDVMMPKISGFEMLDILRNTESLRNVKIIMLTALGQAEDSQRASSLGADRYLVKSQVTLEDIVKAAHELLEGTGDAAETPAPAEEAAAEVPAAAVDDTVAAPAAPEMPVAAPAAPVEEVAAEAPVAPVITEPPVPTPPAEMAAPAPVVEPTIPEPPVAAPPAETVPVVEPTAPMTEVSEPVAEPAAEVAAPAAPAVVPEPAETPAAEAPTPPPIISIPVSDGSADDTTGAASVSDDTAAVDDQPDTGVVEPPSDTPVDSPAISADAPAKEPAVLAPDLSMPTEATDNDSTDADNSLDSAQTAAEPVSDPAVTVNEADTEVGDAGPQSAAAEEASVEAQINDFIANNQPAEATTTSETSTDQAVNPQIPAEDTVSPEPTPAPDQSDDVSTVPDAFMQPEAVVAPTTEVSDVETPEAPAAEAPVYSDAPITANATDPDIPVTEPTPELLDTIAGPVISAPEGADIPDPVPAPVAPVESVAPEASDAAAPAASTLDDQLASAANDLSAGAQNVPAPAGSSRTKVIQPLPSESKPTIHQLLALEEAKNGAQQAVVNTQAPQPNVAAYNPSVPPQQPPAAPGQGIDPNSISL